MADKTNILKEAQKYTSKGQVDKAIGLWEEYVEDKPDANVYNTIGDLYYRKKELDKAVEYFHKAAEEFKQKGFFAKAQALYKKILNINSHDGKALLCIGNLNKERGIINEAVKFYLAAIEAYAKNGDKDKVSKICENITDISADNLALRIKIADYLKEKGFIEEAAKEYLKIGKIYKDKGNIEFAKEYLEKSFELYSDEEIYKVLYDFYISNHEYDKAEELLHKSGELYPNNFYLKVKKAEMMIKDGNLAEAKNILNEILLSSEELGRSVYEEAIRLEGEIYLKEGKEELAWERFKKLIEYYIEDGKEEEAINILIKFKDVAPVECRKRLIEMYRADGEDDKVFNELLELAEIRKEYGEVEEALKAYQEALSIKPDDRELEERVAELQMQQVRPLEEKREEVEEKSISEKILDADIFVRYGLIEEAINLLEKLKVEVPQNIEIHKRLKDLYLEINDKERAISECLILSKLYENKGNLQQKEIVIKEAFEIDPTDPRLIELYSAAVDETSIHEIDEKFISTKIKDFTAKEKFIDKIEEEIITKKSPSEYADEVSEAEFFYRQGLLEDALAIYERIYKLNPDDSFIKERIEELKNSLQGKEIVEEGFEEEIEPELSSEVMTIFEEFKKGIAKEISEEDYDTHYNLGIGYKEMGFIDEAIKEFQIAKKSAKDSDKKVQALSMLGLCYVEKGFYPLAIETLQEALDNLDRGGTSYWSVRFDLAEAYEKSGNLKSALDIYIEIYNWNAKFRGVKEKINKIKALLNISEEAVVCKDNSTKRSKKDRIFYI